jgi:high-affinity iron transporter
MTKSLFNVAITVIFTREILEGSLIVINYRSIILKNDEWDEERKKQSLRTVTIATCIATLVAIAVAVAVAVPLVILGHDLNDRDVSYIEGKCMGMMRDA